MRRDAECPFRVSLIYSDNEGSNAATIANRFGIPFMQRDLKNFYQSMKADRRDLSVRSKYYEGVVNDLASAGGVDFAALAGYMAIITEPLISHLKGNIVNVRPADLSIKDSNGRAKYFGDSAVRKAILEGQRELRSTTHLVTPDVDQGPILLISQSIEVELPPGVTLDDLGREENKALLGRVSDEHQNRLKENGDWDVYPRTIEWLSRGFFIRRPDGSVGCEMKVMPVKGHMKFLES